MPYLMPRRPVFATVAGALLASVIAIAPAFADAATSAGAGSAKPTALAGMPQAPDFPGVVSYVIMDEQTGTIIAQKAPTLAHQPASLTKLMTAYLTYQAIGRGAVRPDESVTVSTEAWKASGSRMFLSEGQTVTIDELLHGLLIQSGNDAAVALGQGVGGTQDAFVQSMNAEARTLGLTGTHYSNVSGLPDPGLQTTALDVARLSRALIEDYPQVLQITAQKDYTFNKIRQRSWNPVLFRDPTVDGLKTGLTDAAGHCIVATAQRNGRRLIAVTLGSPDWTSGTDAIEALLNYGFLSTKNVTVSTPGTPAGTIRDPLSDPEQIAVGPEQAMIVTLPTETAPEIATSFAADAQLPAALPKGTRVGTISYSANGAVVAKTPAVTLSTAQPAGFMTRLFRRIQSDL